MEIAVSFISGALASLILALVFSFSLKGLSRLCINLLTGAVVLALLALCGVMPFNALNAFIVGLLGVPGLIAIFIIVTFL